MAKSVSVAPQFLVAKYAPDMSRMEPRNIGVFLWLKGQLRAKFLSDRDAAVHVQDLHTYRRWVKFWTETISAVSIEPRHGEPVPISDVACLDALLTTQSGNYMLFQAGEMMENLRRKDIDRATEFLFREIVATKSEPTKEQVSRGFVRKCQALLDETGISQREDFRERYPVTIDVYGVLQPLHFSYGLGGEHPTAILQRVNVRKEESITSSLLKLHSLLRTNSGIRRDSVRVMYREADVSSVMGENAVRQFRNECETIDVDADAQAAGSLKNLLSQSA